jgi:hypothetical protein
VTTAPPPPAKAKAKGPLAWARSHRPEAIGIAGGAGVVAVLIVRQVLAKKGAATSASTTSSAGPTGSSASDQLPSYPPGMGTGEFDSLTNQLNGLGDSLQSGLSGLQAQKGPVGPQGPPGPAGGGDGTTAGLREANLPSATAQKLAAPVVQAIPGPAGGDLFLGADGGVFATGGAKFFGSYPGLPASQRTGPRRSFVSIYSTEGGGYTEVDSKGELYHFGPAVTAASSPKTALSGPSASASGTTPGSSTT